MAPSCSRRWVIADFLLQAELADIAFGMMVPGRAVMMNGTELLDIAKGHWSK